MRKRRIAIIHAFGATALVGLLAGQSAFAGPAPSMDQSMPGMPSMPGMKAMPVPQPMPGMSIYNLTSKWTTQDGKEVDLASLRGSVVLGAMVYTHCKDFCPLTTARMQAVERALPKQAQGKVKFVLFSMDWVRDTPEQLRTFASQHHLDLSHWVLLRSDQDAVREMASALGVSFNRQANGDFQHSLATFLFDQNGVVAAEITDYTKPPADIIPNINRLVARS